jgi:uncharacterized protein YbbC (DUF1343 family)
MVTLGIEKLLSNPSILKGKRIGLVGSATSVDRRFRSAVDLMHEHSGIDLTTLFGCQQGFWGETQDNMIEWESCIYRIHGLPLFSLYGKERKPTAKMLSNVDVLVFDVQDVGTRIYTFIWTMVNCMQACAELGKEFIVCDRPNPLNGVAVEGNISEAAFSSFVALYSLPLRHGMTIGEVAEYANGEFKIGCRLTVIKMDGWKRSMWFDETDAPWVIPSANMPTLETAIAYPGTVIFEGTNISEGRGTTRPFEFVGAPFIDGFKLAAMLEEYTLPGVFFRPCFFQPTFQKFTGENCGGVQLHVTDRDAFLPVKTALAMLRTIMDLYPREFAWKEPPYESTFDKPPIDMIFGCEWIRKDLEKGASVENILKRANAELAEFMPKRKKYLSY